MNVITLQSVTKAYGEKIVLDGLNLSIKKNEVFGLLGKNGAGKTTTLECIEGLRKVDQGSIEVNGSLGVQLQSSSIPPLLKVEEIVTLFAKWNKVNPDNQLLDIMSLTSLRKSFYGLLSTGQKRRVHLALALMKNPDILILDEPTAGLDIEGKLEIYELIQQLKRDGKTIVLSTHDLSEVEQLCDRVAIIDHGKLIHCSTVKEFAQNHQRFMNLHVDVDGDLEGYTFDQSTMCYVISTEDLHQTVTRLMKEIQSKNLRIRDIYVKKAQLETQFMHLLEKEEDYECLDV